MRYARFLVALVTVLVTGCSASEGPVDSASGRLADNGSAPPVDNSAAESQLFGEWIADEGGLATPGQRVRLSFATTGRITSSFPLYAPHARSGAFTVTGDRLVVSPSTVLTGTVTEGGHPFTVTADGKLLVHETMFGTLQFRRPSAADLPKADEVWRASVVGTWSLVRGCAPEGNASRVSEIELGASGDIRVRRGPADARGTYTVADGHLVTVPADLLAGGQGVGAEGVLESLEEGSLSVTWIESMCFASTFQRR